MADDNPNQVTAAKLSVTDSGNAPFIYFEGVPNFGHLNGIINLTLATSRHLLKDGASATDFVVAAHLRCNMRAAMELRKAIDDALLLAAPPPKGSEGKAN
jgi:hypothetical protein